MAILIWTAISVEGVLPGQLLWLFKEPEQQSQSTPEEKIRWGRLPSFPLLQQLHTAVQLCPFGQASIGWPEATMRLVQPGCVITATVFILLGHPLDRKVLAFNDSRYLILSMAKSVDT